MGSRPADPHPVGADLRLRRPQGDAARTGAAAAAAPVDLAFSVLTGKAERPRPPPEERGRGRSLSPPRGRPRNGGGYSGAVPTKWPLAVISSPTRKDVDSSSSRSVNSAPTIFPSVLLVTWSASGGGRERVTREISSRHEKLDSAVPLRPIRQPHQPVLRHRQKHPAHIPGLGGMVRQRQETTIDVFKGGVQGLVRPGGGMGCRFDKERDAGTLPRGVRTIPVLPARLLRVVPAGRRRHQVRPAAEVHRHQRRSR